MYNDADDCVASKRWWPNPQNHGSIVSRRPSLPFVQVSGKKDERLHGSAAHIPVFHLPGWSWSTLLDCNKESRTTLPQHTVLHHRRWFAYHTWTTHCADQDWPKPTILGSTDESTFYTFWGIDRPYILSSFPSRGGSSRVINAFSWFSSADKYFSSLFEDLVEKMSTAHIWTVACWGVWRLLERCFITAVCKRQIDYLDTTSTAN